MNSSSNHAVTFVTKQHCGLCDAAHERVVSAAKMLGIDLETVDIGDRPDLEPYLERVPVVLDDVGTVLLEGRFGSIETYRKFLALRMRVNRG